MSGRLYKSRSQEKMNHKFSILNEQKKNKEVINKVINKEEKPKNNLTTLKEDFDKTNKEVKQEMKEKDKKRNHTQRNNIKRSRYN